VFEQILVEDGQVGQLVAHRILEEVGDGLGVVGQWGKFLQGIQMPDQH
jgi:hypothetical protein